MRTYIVGPEFLVALPCGPKTVAQSRDFVLDNAVFKGILRVLFFLWPFDLSTSVTVPVSSPMVEGATPGMRIWIRYAVARLLGKYVVP